MSMTLVLASYAPSLINFRGALLDALVDAGQTVIASAPEDDPAIREKLSHRGVRYEPLPLKRAGLTPVADLVWFFRLYRLFRRYRPDLVLTYTVKPVIYGSLAARAARVPRLASIVTGLGFALMAASPLSRLVRCLYRLALAHNDVVFFQNPDDMADFARLGILPPGGTTPRTVLIDGSGVDLEYFPEQPLSEPASPGEMVFLLIARFLKDKGIIEYVEAARIVKRKYPRTRFQIVGFHDVNPAALGRDQIERWIDEGLIECLGEASDVRPYLRDCHVYVLPSYREGTPRTVLEAMATGRAIVTTDVPGCRETVSVAGGRELASRPPIREGENGFLVPVRDSVNLATALERFILNPGLLDAMGRRSREYAEMRYDVHRVNKTILTALQVSDPAGASREIGCA